MAIDPGQTVMKGLLEVFILESLGRGPKHGYALLKEMEECFGEEPNRNKIYPLLQRFEGAGLIRRTGGDDEEGRTRTEYALTEDGSRELDAYRRLPGPFREMVRRLWAAAGPVPEPASGNVPVVPVPTAPAAPVPAPQGAELPYPCPDARAAVEKDPRTGNLGLTLTGCPMGAYEYCPLCPVYKSVQGLRHLVFPGP